MNVAMVPTPPETTRSVICPQDFSMDNADGFMACGGNHRFCLSEKALTEIVSSPPCRGTLKRSKVDDDMVASLGTKGE